MTPLAPGDVIAGKYEIRRQIGKGGFGAVYAGIQLAVGGRLVAIKVIRPEKADNKQLIKRFEREAKALGGLRNPSTVTLHDYGVDGDRLYMVMEFVEGTELSKVIRTDAPLAPGRVAALSMQAATALTEAHAKGLIHRDIKPANMMVSRGPLGEEQLKLLDFGIAKLLGSGEDDLATATGIVIGTVAYMSPEQSIGRGVGPATDQYSLGVVMYHMLTGRKPFQAPSALEVLNMHRSAPIPRMPTALGVPGVLEVIVRRAMSKDPHDRFPNMASMARALRAVTHQVPDDTVAAPPMQERSTALGVTPASEPLWVPEGVTSMEVNGAIDRTRGVGSWSPAAFGLLLVIAAGSGIGFALMATEWPAPTAELAEADVATRISLAPMGEPTPSAVADAAGVDASAPDARIADAEPDQANDAAKKKTRRPARRSPARRRRQPAAPKTTPRPAPVRVVHDPQDQPPTAPARQPAEPAPTSAPSRIHNLGAR